MKPTEFIVKVTPKGDIFFLYDDNSPLRSLGKMQLQRASNVEWDEKAQGWVVWINDHKTKTIYKRRRLTRVFTNRGDAIQAEVEILNERLLSGAPVEQLFDS